MIIRAIEKCMKERSWKVEHDNARSERTRKGWVGREWTTIHLADLSIDQCLHFWVISYHSNTAKLYHSVTFFWTGLFCLLFLTGKKVNAACIGQKVKWNANIFENMCHNPYIEINKFKYIEQIINDLIYTRQTLFNYRTQVKLYK